MSNNEDEPDSLFITHSSSTNDAILCATLCARQIADFCVKNINFNVLSSIFYINYHTIFHIINLL